MKPNEVDESTFLGLLPKISYIELIWSFVWTFTSTHLKRNYPLFIYQIKIIIKKTNLCYINPLDFIYLDGFRFNKNIPFQSK